MKFHLQKNARDLLIILLIGVPVANFLSGVLALLVYGLDMPIFDEWRNYQHQRGAFYYLFKPVNDTYSPIGFFLEGLAQKYLAGNVVAHGVLSMLVMLSSFLWVQWKLLGLVFKDNLLRASVFSFCILIMQSMSYWGIESANAYVQGIPLLACLWMIYTLLAHDPTRRSFSIIMISLGLISGLSYISGAFILIPFWLSCFIFKRIFAYDTNLVFRFKKAVNVLLIPMLITVSIQLHALWFFGGSHSGEMSSVLSVKFWMLIFGKIARSLALMPEYSSLLLSMVIFIFIFCLSLYALYLTRFKIEDKNKQNIIIIFLQLFLIIGGYLILIGAGRGTFGVHDGMTSLDLFKFGLMRHHFFWVTPFWVWVLAFCLVIFGFSTKLCRHERYLQIWSIVCITVTLFVSQLNSFQHSLFSRYLRLTRMPLYSCLQNIYQDQSLTGCDSFYEYPKDVEGAKKFVEEKVKALNFAKSFGSTFFDFVNLPKTAGIKPFASDTLLFASDADFKKNMQWHHVNIEKKNTGIQVKLNESPSDPYVDIVFNSVKLESCQKIQVSVKQANSEHNFGQLFYKPRGNTDFTVQNSQIANATKGDSIMTFIIESAAGFEPLIRLNPLGNKQAVILYKLEAYCLVGDSST